MRFPESQMPEPEHILCICLTSRSKAIGRTHRLWCRRRFWSSSHLLRTHKAIRTSTRRQHQVDTMVWVGGRICAAHRLPTAGEHESSSSRLIYPMFLMPRDDLEQLSQHIDDDIPQPAHTSHSAARSVERAMGAGHGLTGWVCKAASAAADLARRWSARRSLHRVIVGAVRVGCGPTCKKGLR